MLRIRVLQRGNVNENRATPVEESLVLGIARIALRGSVSLPGDDRLRRAQDNSSTQEERRRNTGRRDQSRRP
jgi:hypothetical protein